MKLRIAPVDFDTAAAFVLDHHRHHTPPVGHKFSLAAMLGEACVGVAIVGRPVSRERDDGCAPSLGCNTNISPAKAAAAA